MVMPPSLERTDNCALATAHGFQPEYSHGISESPLDSAGGDLLFWFYTLSQTVAGFKGIAFIGWRHGLNLP